MSTAPEAMPRHMLERQLRKSRLLNVILAVLAALALVFGGVQWSQNGATSDAAPSARAEGSGGSPGDTAGGQAGAKTASLERRIKGDAMAIGDIDAPIVLTEWVDLRCPYCAVFTRDTLPDILAEYVDSGQVRIEMQDVAFFGEESLRASAAARAAAEQGHYFEFLDAVYAAAPESGHAELAAEELLGHARSAGVPDMKRFEEDMARDDLRAAASQATSEASQLGVSGVPFFVVNGQGISGAQPIDTFRQLLDQALADLT